MRCECQVTAEGQAGAYKAGSVLAVFGCQMNEYAGACRCIGYGIVIWQVLAAYVSLIGVKNPLLKY